MGQHDINDGTVDTVTILQNENTLAALRMLGDPAIVGHTATCIKHASRLVSFECGPADAHIPFLFQSQLHNNLWLSLVSLLRMHQTQFYMMMRHSIESAVFAAYALHKYNRTNYCQVEGEFSLNDKVRCKAYKWIEEKAPDESAYLKKRKEFINDWFAHAHILNSAFSLTTAPSATNPEFTVDIADQIPRPLWLQQMFILADISIEAGKMIIHAAAGSPIASISNLAGNPWEKLQDSHAKLREKLLPVCNL